MRSRPTERWMRRNFSREHPEMTSAFAGGPGMLYLTGVGSRTGPPGGTRRPDDAVTRPMLRLGATTTTHPKVVDSTGGKNQISDRSYRRPPSMRPEHAAPRGGRRTGRPPGGTRRPDGRRDAMLRLGATTTTHPGAQDETRLLCCRFRSRQRSRRLTKRPSPFWVSAPSASLPGHSQ